MKIGKIKQKDLLAVIIPAVAVIIWITLAFAFLNPSLWKKSNSLDNNANVTQEELTPEVSPSPSPTPTPTTTPKPNPSAKTTPAATPKSNKLFKVNSILEWDSARPTHYPFGIYAFEPLSKVEFTFEEDTQEIQAINNGVTYVKTYRLRVGENKIQVKAETASGKSQTETFTVINKDSLSDVDVTLVGRKCSEADTQHCANYSGYTRPGLCKEYRVYLLCLQSKCDVSTLEEDKYCNEF